MIRILIKIIFEINLVRIKVTTTIFNFILFQIKDNFIPENKTVVTVDDIKALPLQSWRNLISFLEMDPANTLQYEYKTFTRNDVL